MPWSVSVCMEGKLKNMQQTAPNCYLQEMKWGFISFLSPIYLCV